MKYFFILSKEKKAIEWGRTLSKRFELLNFLVHYVPTLNTLISVAFEQCHLEKKINNLFEIRNSNLLDIPNYDKKYWKEEDIFEMKQYKEYQYKLCKTGFDNSLIFLINIYSALLDEDNNNHPTFLFFANTQIEFQEWQKSLFFYKNDT